MSEPPHPEKIGTKCGLRVDVINQAKIQMNIQTTSTIICPVCGYQKEEQMPESSCQFFYECESCHTVLKPEKGDCCVFCSYGTVSCPPVQNSDSCC